ncbi:MAG: 50S ribosomal protein L11 methyltransferase [Bacteroides sp.]|nr:50S ribosomal protein L11 methyltransferase [Bacteroides sp.]MCM1085796.1 50S ribosomal protein L11 methyltransferase [Bacteroides sp.]
MNYVSVCLHHALDEVRLDLLVDALGEAGFESFETEGGVLTAYIPQPAYQDNKESIEAVLGGYGPFGQRTDTVIEDRDWNAVWESSYRPVRFGDFCFVHAPFHEPLEEVRYNIRIEPKMSFGTAHHPTTALMIQFLQEFPPVGEHVLDMGCGTGVLGILAAMQGAGSVTGIDVDEWAYRNALENVQANGFSEQGACPFRILLGDAKSLSGKRFNRIIANINRNILVNDMAAYASALETGGSLYLSGFYEQDMEILERACNANRLFYKQHRSQDNWAAMRFVKK